MSGIDELHNREREHEGPLEGEIVEPAPTYIYDPVYVRITGWHHKHKLGPLAWPYRGGMEYMPAVGDVCAVAETDSGAHVVVAWWRTDWPTREEPSFGGN